MHTPFDVHHGNTDAVHHARAWVLRSAYPANPERFVRRPPEPLALPEAAWINRPEHDLQPAQ